MQNENIKPSVLGTLDSILDTGLTLEMLITILAKRTGLNRTKTKKCLDSLVEIEKQLKENYQKRTYAEISGK